MHKLTILILGEIDPDKSMPQTVITSHPDLTVAQYNKLGEYLAGLTQDDVNEVDSDKLVN